MHLSEWLEGISDKTEVRLESIRDLDGVPNVAVVTARVKRPVPGGFNSWIWILPMEPETQEILGGDNPLVLVWGPDWFEYADTFMASAF